MTFYLFSVLITDGRSSQCFFYRKNPRPESQHNYKLLHVQFLYEIQLCCSEKCSNTRFSCATLAIYVCTLLFMKRKAFSNINWHHNACSKWRRWQICSSCKLLSSLSFIYNNKVFSQNNSKILVLFSCVYVLFYETDKFSCPEVFHVM